jgi:hypothetical protein
MSLSSLGVALHALHAEAFEFRFQYPLMIVPEAGPKTLPHYYLYKYEETPAHRRVMHLDSDGIPQFWSRTTGLAYRPAFIAMYGLGRLSEYLQTGEQASLDIFFKQCSWLEQHAVLRDDGAVTWTQNFTVQDGPVLLKAPWVSANVQGFVISALVRYWRLKGDPRTFALLKQSIRLFQLDQEEGGIRVQAEGHIVYTEAPGLPCPGIMDGFMRSLLGLYDLYVETGEAEVHDLFVQGIEGLRHFLPRWDYRRKWSWYANRHYLSAPQYHNLNRLLLEVLARLTGDAYLAEYADGWCPDRLSPLDRAEIYLVFLWTKNMCRWKYRTWHHTSVMDLPKPRRSPNSQLSPKTKLAG